LLHHDLPLSEKETVWSQMVWEAEVIHFDDAYFVVLPFGESGWEEIAAWKTVFTRELRSNC
jgi:hypothetical protein